MGRGLLGDFQSGESDAREHPLGPGADRDDGDIGLNTPVGDHEVDAGVFLLDACDRGLPAHLASGRHDASLELDQRG